MYCWNTLNTVILKNTRRYQNNLGDKYIYNQHLRQHWLVGTPCEQFFSPIMARTSYFWWDDADVCFVLNQRRWCLLCTKPTHLIRFSVLAYMYIKCELTQIVWGLWCLMPLSNIFWLCCGSQFYWWKKSECLEITWHPTGL
jgi:hypothetical protein